MRWKLKTTLGIVALICIFLARIGFIHNQYQDLRAAGVQLYFDWQNPVIEETTLRTNRIIENKSIPMTILSQEYGLAPQQRTWGQKLSNSLVSNEPVAIEIDARKLPPELIQTVKSMPKLRQILLTHAVYPIGPVDPEGEALIQKLNFELPDVEIRLGLQNVSFNAAGQ